MNKSFEVIHRNPGHWDIYHKSGDAFKRIALIRGEPGNVLLWGSGPFDNDPERKFPSVESCMAYVCATLMKE